MQGSYDGMLGSLHQTPMMASCPIIRSAWERLSLPGLAILGSGPLPSCIGDDALKQGGIR
jgi:hypothetical protein